MQVSEKKMAQLRKMALGQRTYLGHYWPWIQKIKFDPWQVRAVLGLLTHQITLLYNILQQACEQCVQLVNNANKTKVRNFNVQFWLCRSFGFRRSFLLVYRSDIVIIDFNGSSVESARTRYLCTALL